MADKGDKEVYKCSTCRCKYFIEDFGFTRLEKRYKICVKCREKKKIKNIKKCDFEGCEYSTVYSCNLITHKRTHTGDKPYECDFEGCEYSTAYSHHLTTHIRTHTGEKPYECEFEGCEYSTAYSGHLTKHKRTHTGEKPYECDQCEYSTVYSANLTRHKRIHTGEKPFECDQCDYKCSDGSTFTKHKNFNCNRGNPAKNTSAAELHTILVLKELGLLFIHGLPYDNVRHIQPLKFDFRVNPDTPYQFFIETDGKQHTKPNRLYGGEEGFKIIQLRDKIKNDYCGDRLLRIPHTTPLKDYRKLILDFATRDIIIYDE